MSQRKLYLAAYDITQSRRLKQFSGLLKEYSGSGQKSVFECWLSHKEKKELIQRARDLMDMDEDRFILFKLHAQTPVITLGQAATPQDENFIAFL